MGKEERKKFIIDKNKINQITDLSLIHSFVTDLHANRFPLTLTIKSRLQVFIPCRSD